MSTRQKSNSRSKVRSIESQTNRSKKRELSQPKSQKLQSLHNQRNTTKQQNHKEKYLVKHQQLEKENDETDVEIESHQHVKWKNDYPQYQKKKGKRGIKKKEEEKQYHYQEDIIFHSRSQQQSQQIAKKENLVNSNDGNRDDVLSRKQSMKQSKSFRSQSITKTQSQRSSSLKEIPSLGSKSLSKAQTKYKQNVQQIMRTKYPQNVMHRVHPLDEKLFIHEKKKPTKQQQDQVQQLAYQSFQQNQKEKKCQQPLWTRAQHRVIEINLKWIAFTIIDDRITEINKDRESESKDILIFDIDFEQVPDINKIKQKLLELKCLLRYRSINSILKILKEFIDGCYQHNQLLGLTYIFHKHDFLKLLSIQVEDFYNMAMEKFIKLIVVFTNQYKQASKQNKQLVLRMFCQKQQQERQLKKQNDVKQLLINEGIFKPWMKMMNKRWYMQSRLRNSLSRQKKKRQSSKNKKNQDVEI